MYLLFWIDCIFLVENMEEEIFLGLLAEIFLVHLSSR